jgi:hypothetical protein
MGQIIVNICAIIGGLSIIVGLFITDKNYRR